MAYVYAVTVRTMPHAHPPDGRTVTNDYRTLREAVEGVNLHTTQPVPIEVARKKDIEHPVVGCGPFFVAPAWVCDDNTQWTTITRVYRAV